MCCKILHFAMITTAMTSRREILRHSQEDPDYSIVSCANLLASEFFEQPQNIVILSRNPIQSMPQNFMHFARIVADNPDFVHPKDSNITKDAVILLEPRGTKVDIDMLRSLKRFHPRGKYIIGVLNGRNQGNSREYLTEIIAYSISLGRSNVILLNVAYPHGKVRVYGCTDRSYKNCGQPKLVDYGLCGSKETTGKIFPQSLNFNECPIRLAVLPFPHLVEVYKENGRTKSRGFESQMIDWIVQKLNATPMILERICSSDKKSNDPNSLNCSVDSVGIKRMIREERADIGWGYMMQLPMEGVAYTDSYFFLHARIMVPVIGPRHFWTDLILPLQNEVWTCLAVLISSAVTLKVLVPPLRRAFPIGYIIASFFGFGAPNAMIRASQRIYFLSWIWFAYIIMQAYLASLTGLYTKPSQRFQIQTLKQLDETDLPIGGFESMREQFRETNPRIYRDYQVMDLSQYYDNLDKLQTGRRAVSTHVADLQMMSMSTGMSSEHFHVIPEVISFYPIAALMPKTSAILHGSNRVISGILEGGIFEITKQQATAKRAMFMKGSSHEDNGGTRKITLAHLRAVFFMLAVGAAISSVTFVIELIVANRRQR